MDFNVNIVIEITAFISGYMQSMKYEKMYFAAINKNINNTFSDLLSWRGMP